MTWNDTCVLLPFPADLPQVPPWCLWPKHGERWSSLRISKFMQIQYYGILGISFLFSIPWRFCPTLIHSFPPSPGSPLSYQLLPDTWLHWTRVESHSTLCGGERWVLLSPRDASKGICFPLTQHDNFFFQEAFLDHLSQSLAFLWTHSIYFLASTFCNSSPFASWHFLYHCHELSLMSPIFMLLSPQLNFKFLEGVYASGYSPYCLDFNNFAIWFKVWLDSKIHFIECPKQED